MTLLFENVQTVWYQVEEMLRTERISDEAAIRHEIDTYNELLPRPGELSATMLIEYGDPPPQREAALRDLLGLERHVWICIDQRRESVRFDERQVSLDRVSAVQFVRFPLGGLIALSFSQWLTPRNSRSKSPSTMKGRALIEGSMARALAQDLL